MKEKKLLLIFTPIDIYYKDADTHYSPSLSLISLKTFIDKELPNIEISVLDGSVCCTQEDIIEHICRERPTHVAQSIQLISYDNCLEIAKVAKSVGATTIVGGHHATQLAKNIVSNQQGVIDFVVAGDGEFALLGLLNDSDISTIPNLVYLRSGHTVFNATVNPCLNEYPVPDYSDIDYAPYKHLLTTSAFNTDGSKKYLRMYSHKGCGNRGGSESCIFCGRADKNVRFKSPELYWKDLCNLVINNKADYIFDVGDDFLASKKWLEKVVSLKPDIEDHYKLGIFGRANRVTKRKAELIKKLNVSDVVIGFETGSSEVMAQIGKKNTSVSMSIKAAEHLFRQNIDVCASFVFGLPGETEKSMEATIKTASQIVELSKSIRGVKPREMVGNLLEPSPGSPAFKKIVKAFPEQYLQTDILKLEELQYDYFRVFFGVESLSEYDALRQKMVDYAMTLHSLVEFSDSQGWLSKESVAA